MHATQKGPTPVPPTIPDVEPASADLLRRAADYLAAHGWIQRSHYSDGHSDTPAACAAGALAIAAYGYPHPEPRSSEPAEPGVEADLDAWHAFVVTESLLEHFLELNPCDNSDGPSTLYEWNDVDGRAAADVITTLRAAADTIGPVAS